MVGFVGDGFVDDGGGNDVVVEYDGEGLFDIFCGDVGKVLGVVFVEVEWGDWFFGVGIDVWCSGVDIGVFD